jgi:hypothetical protein
MMELVKITNLCRPVQLSVKTPTQHSSVLLSMECVCAIYNVCLVANKTPQAPKQPTNNQHRYHVKATMNDRISCGDKVTTGSELVPRKGRASVVVTEGVVCHSSR